MERDLRACFVVFANEKRARRSRSTSRSTSRSGRASRAQSNAHGAPCVPTATHFTAQAALGKNGAVRGAPPPYGPTRTRTKYCVKPFTGVMGSVMGLPVPAVALPGMNAHGAVARFVVDSRV